MRCEARTWAETLCSRDAVWRVRVGTRESDAQRSCAQHLNQTAQRMLKAEDRPGATITLVPV